MVGLTSRLVSQVAKLRTPLAIAGLVLVVMYAVISQILKLDVFSNIGGNATYDLLNNIVTDLFYLALITILLAVATYALEVLIRRRPAPRRSGLQIIDASLDQTYSDYVVADNTPTHTRVIRRQPQDRDVE